MHHEKRRPVSTVSVQLFLGYLDVSLIGYFVSKSSFRASVIIAKVEGRNRIRLVEEPPGEGWAG